MPRYEPVESHTSLAKDDEGVWDGESRPLANLADPELPQDAATKAYVDTGGHPTLIATPAFFAYDFSNLTTPPPTSSQVRLDAPPPYTDVTHLWVRFIATDGADLYWALMAIQPESLVFLQDKNDHTLYVEMRATGALVDAGTHVDLPVTWLAGNGTLNNNQAVLLVVRGTTVPYV